MNTSIIWFCPRQRLRTVFKERPDSQAATGYVRSKARFQLDAIVVENLATNESVVMWLGSRAYRAEMKAPMLVPPTRSTGMPASSSALRTPTCANPRAPPPPKTTPTDRPVRCRARRATSERALAVDTTEDGVCTTGMGGAPKIGANRGRIGEAKRLLLLIALLKSEEVAPE